MNGTSIDSAIKPVNATFTRKVRAVALALVPTESERSCGALAKQSFALLRRQNRLNVMIGVQ